MVGASGPKKYAAPRGNYQFPPWGAPKRSTHAGSLLPQKLLYVLPPPIARGKVRILPAFLSFRV